MACMAVMSRCTVTLCFKVVCTSKYTKNFVKDGGGFPENGCYGNQPQSLEVLFDSINCNNTVTIPALSQNKI